MFKYLLIAFSLLFMQSPLMGATDHSNKPGVYCSPQLRTSLAKIEKIPEARELIAAIIKEGSFRILAKNTGLSNQFGAFWDRDQRVICIALSPQIDEASIIGSLLFELHNAAVNSKFDELDQLAIRGKINKNKYVESMEYIEYVNSLDTAKMAEEGIRLGVIPKGSRLYTYRNFEEHFKAQLQSGHSRCFAECYDGLFY